MSIALNLVTFHRDINLSFSEEAQEMAVEEYALIPREAFLFFPEEKDVFQTRNNKPYRIIFEGGVPYTEYEKEMILELQAEIRKSKGNHQIAFMQESTMLRFLQANKFDVEDTIDQLQRYKKWEDSMFPLTLKAEIELLLKRGFFYMIGRDCKYRPIIVVDVQKVHQADLKEKTFYELMGYFFQYIVQNCFVEGQVETWITIVDLAKMGLFSLGGTVIDTIKFLSSHFKCRLHHNYLVNCPGSMTFLFGMVKKVLKEDQIAKITLLEEACLPQEAFNSIHPDQVEQKYGGAKRDLTEFWPIQPNYSQPTSQQKQQLISVAEYGRMHQNGLLGCKKVSKGLLQQYQALQREEERIARLQKQTSIEKDLKKLLEEQEEQPSWEEPPEIGIIPQPFSMHEFFKESKQQLQVSLEPKNR